MTTHWKSLVAGMTGIVGLIILLAAGQYADNNSATDSLVASVQTPVTEILPPRLTVPVEKTPGMGRLLTADELELMIQQENAMTGVLDVKEALRNRIIRSLHDAREGSAVDQFKIGVRHYRGRGLLQDYKAGAEWFIRAAEQGYTAAQFNLGWMYAGGYGVPQDYVRSHMWYNIAGATGDDEAGRYRTTVARLMTTAQIAEAQRLAQECIQKEYKGC